jgi:hypothetical protein
MSLTRERRLAQMQRSAQLVERYKPTFFSGTTVQEAIDEAREIVLLRFINQMDAESLGLSNPSLVIKFKALLQIITHTLFIKKQPWVTQETAYTEKFLKEQCLSLSKSVHKVLHPQRHVIEKLDNNAQKERIKNIFDASSQDDIKIVKSYFEMRTLLYSENFSCPSLAFDNTIKKISADLTPSDSIEVIFNRVYPLFKIFAMQTQFENEKYLLEEFNFKELHHKIAQKKQINIKAICEDRNILSKEKDFLILNNAYILYRIDFKSFLDETAHDVQQLFPKFHEDLFTALFHKAFEKILGNEFWYWNNFLFELILQEIRKPALYAEIQEVLQTVYMPMINITYTFPPEGNAGYLAKLLNEIKKVTLNRTQDALSLQQILAGSYIHLFSLLTLSQLNASTNFLPLSMPSEEDKQEVKIQDVTSILSPYIETTQTPPPLQAQLLPIMDMQIQPLFYNKDVPDFISVTDISILYAINRHIDEYQKHYDKFSKLPMNSPQHHDRVKAVEKFSEDYAKADSVAKIAALVLVAKPYINRHRRFDFDTTVGKSITHTWSKLLKVARDDALRLLEVQVTPLDDKNAINALECWRQLGLFSQHRANFKIRGAFGRTHAQTEIDTMILTRSKNR